MIVTAARATDFMVLVAVLDIDASVGGDAPNSTADKAAGSLSKA